MKNEEYWNEKIQNRVEDYVKNDTGFSKLNSDEFCCLAESLTKFLRAFREDVYREVEREYHREDVLSKIKELFSEKTAVFFSSLPIYLINSIVEEWQNDLEDSDSYWEAFWDSLVGILTETSYLGNLESYNDEELELYKAYLINWFQEHNEGAPACIGEFFDCEMCQNEKISEENNDD